MTGQVYGPGQHGPGGRLQLNARLDRPFRIEELTEGLGRETYLVAHP